MEKFSKMEKKEFYRHYLPHFQQPGQAYFVTWCLKDAVPAKALQSYTLKLEMLKSQISALGGAPGSGDRAGRTDQTHGSGEFYSPQDNLSAVENRGTRSRETYQQEFTRLKSDYYILRKKYLKAYDDLLDAERNPTVSLSKPLNTEILIESLTFWEGKRITNFAFTIMPNHVHWVFEVKEKDEKGKGVYLQDLLQSVKRFSANRINKLEHREGHFWQKESFDTTIRNEVHLYNAINYTLKNPVAAGLVSDWTQWSGSWCGVEDFL